MKWITCFLCYRQYQEGEDHRCPKSNRDSEYLYRTLFLRKHVGPLIKIK